MINYKRIIFDIVVVGGIVSFFGLSIDAAPAEPTPTAQDKKAECKMEPEYQRHYDQRQNGTENYRLNVDGVVIAIAPADSLLTAASEIDFTDLLTDLESQQKPEVQASKPGPSLTSSSTDIGPKDNNSNKKEKVSRIRLANLLRPFLRRNRKN